MEELIKKELKDFNHIEVNEYVAYLKTLMNAKTSKGDMVNKWFPMKDHLFFVNCFKQANTMGVLIDGKHTTVGINGLSLDYVAYKNRMLTIYPETKLSFSEVYDGDEFSFEQTDGKVIYSHKFSNPFDRNPTKIIGVYCIIKNNRGEFLTLLSKNEIEKHRRLSKTSTIWDLWFLEMAYKTVIKKATRIHFNDIYEKMNEVDNESIDLEQEVEKSQEEIKTEIMEIINNAKSLDDLKINSLFEKLTNKAYIDLVKQAGAKKKAELEKVML